MPPIGIVKCWSASVELHATFQRPTLNLSHWVVSTIVTEMGRHHAGFVLRDPVLDVAVIFILRPQHQISGCHGWDLWDKLKWLKQEAHGVPGEAMLGIFSEWGMCKESTVTQATESCGRNPDFHAMDKLVLSISHLRKLWPWVFIDVPLTFLVGPHSYFIDVGRAIMNSKPALFTLHHTALWGPGTDPGRAKARSRQGRLVQCLFSSVFTVLKE